MEAQKAPVNWPTLTLERLQASTSLPSRVPGVRTPAGRSSPPPQVKVGVVMSTFTPGHLGKWEQLFHDLVEGVALPLTPEGTWMLGEKPGLLAIFDETGPIYIGPSSNIARDTRACLSGGAVNEFRTLLAIQDLRASPKNAEARAKSGPLAVRLNKRVAKLNYRVVAAPNPMLGPLAEAFTVVADPRLNGPTAAANRALDALI